MNPKAIGEISEGVVLAHLLKQGRAVLLPFGNNQRYDFVLDEDGTLVRAQVKTGRLGPTGCITFKTSSINGFTGKRTNYAGAADIFLVYCPETEGIYRVPVSDCGESCLSLRVHPPRGGPKSVVRWAHDYEV